MADPIMDFQSAPINAGGLPTAHDKQKSPMDVVHSGDMTVSAAHDVYEGGEGFPTEEELTTLRRISAPMP